MSNTGRCLCKAVSFTLATPPTNYSACHCGMCRRMSGGVQFGVQTQPGEITWQGEESLKTYPSSQWAERGFCGTCGSSLFWRMTAPGPMNGMTVIAGGALDSLDGMTFDSEIYIDSKPESHAFAGDRKRMTEAELMALMGGGAG
ncbi:MAG: GFA family protein [Sandaracinaceae bacterium]